MRQIVHPFSLSFFLLAGVAGTLDAQSLRGSPQSVDRMYNQAKEHDLKFHRTQSSVLTSTKKGALVKLSENRNYRLSGVNYPYVLPSTRTFVQRLGEQYRGKCGDKLVVTSGARPENFQLVNAHAKSVHPTGMAVDLRKPRSEKCLKWLRETLLAVEKAGVIEATEERNPPHFHVAVFPRPYTRYVSGEKGGEALASAGESKKKSSSKGSDSEAETTRYRVRKGDNLSVIARRHGTTVKEIRQANNLRSSRLQPGQMLDIPSNQ